MSERNISPNPPSRESKILITQRSLWEFSDRVAYVVTDLNGLIGSIVNDEVTVADFDHDLTTIFAKLNEVEGAVTELADGFYREEALASRVEPEEQNQSPEQATTREAEPPDLETLKQWESEGYCEATDGCVVEPDGTCPHGHQSWLLELGLI